MKDKELKSKIAKIIAGSIKSAIHDHPEYLSKDRKYIVRRALSSIAKRASGNVLRLMREDFEGLPPVKKMMTGRMPPGEFAEVSQHQLDELVKSFSATRVAAEKKFVSKMASEFWGKSRC